MVMREARFCDVNGTVDDVIPVSVVVLHGMGPTRWADLAAQFPELQETYAQDLGEKARKRLLKSIETGMNPPVERAATPEPPPAPAPPNETTTGPAPDLANPA